MAILVLTGLLILPIFFMAPSEPASQDPGGPVYDLQDLVNQRFPQRLHITSLIVEDREGDILRQAPLWELYQNEASLRASDLAELLFNGYDVDNQRQIAGVYTIADAVHNLFLLDSARGVTLETATDAQVKEAVSRILDSPNARPLRTSLSKDAWGASSQPLGVGQGQSAAWKAEALSVFVVSDNTRLGGGQLAISLAADEVTLGKERFNRRVQAILRGQETNYRLWGVAIDLNLVSREQGRGAIPFIAATVFLVLIVVGFTLRSFRIVGLTFLGLAMTLVWLKGLSNLVGLNSSLTLDLVVPIAMISLGVDFLIHAVVRYREERTRHPEPSLALLAGFTGVLGALTLAMLSDGIAFLANVTSGIETIIGFGIGAGIAVGAGYVIMGLFLPLVIMRLDQRHPSVLLHSASGRSPPTLQYGATIAGVVVALARLRWVVLPVAAAVTVASVYLAFQLEPRLDIKDFFDEDSDFVIGLDKLDQHTAAAVSGEPAILYIQGDLTAAESLAGLSELLERLSNNEFLGKSEDGRVSLYSRPILRMLSRLTGSDYAMAQVEATTGVAVTDLDGNQVPDGPEQVGAAYSYMVEHGVPLNSNTMVYDPIQVQEIVFYDPARPQDQATIIVVGVLGTRQQANIGAARESLERDLAPLSGLSTISFAGLTGSPFTRESTLRATTRALNISLPVAVAACLVLLTIWMRSLSLAVVTTIPIGLVVSWLYAFMYLAGYHLNFVTATIAAVSIGVGIDYSIHMTQRFRQEMAGGQEPVVALRAAAAGTGVALTGSAASSVIGFAVLGFAPMPLFSAYGVITATMIFMAAIATLLVLPSLLILVARASPPRG